MLTEDFVYHVAVLFNLMEPPLHVGEGLPVRDIVHHDDAVRASVVRAGDRPEPLLTRSIPYLKLHSLTVYF